MATTVTGKVVTAREGVKIPKSPGPRCDDGLFGPGSITWEVAGHPVVGLAGWRNAIYTALSSGVSQAVVDHSKQMIDPWSRVRETAYWVYISVFSDTVEARRAGKWVEGMHRKSTGYDPVAGRDYSPFREDLAIAGHCLIWDSQLAAYETYVRVLSDAEREQYWQEGLRIPELLGIDPQIMPQTYADWLRYLDSVIRPGLSYSIAGHKIYDFTVSATWVPFWGRPAVRLLFRLVDELTLATLGPIERTTYGKPRSPWRLALTRRAGVKIAALTARPALRNLIERALGARIHKVMSEARKIDNGQFRTATSQKMAG
ncbi:oxygenase MpaB family protein [Mycobacteroides abscessus]|uniref:oxygenase MpaB family protein n=1 Tax=Mycobacteroides abscessus TaxID=36809 RepID=UPI000C25D89E|nr:oxygenase MpaB family protein [Mycobacteroides abscessus]